MTIPFQNFAFTDPVAAQQAVQMGQIASLAQAEKDKNMAGYAQEVLRQRTAQQNAARQQAIQQGQMNQQMAEANLNRQARATETDKVLNSQEKVAGMQLQGKNDFKELDNKFNDVAALIDSEDPPTDMEFESLSTGLPQDRKFILKRALDSKRRALGSLASEAQNLADFWNSKFDDVKVGEDQKFTTLKQEFSKDRRAQELLSKDPRYTFRFLPKYKGPRLDSTNPNTGNLPGVTSIDDLRARLNPSNVTVTPVPSPGGFTPQPTDFAVPQQPQVPFRVPIPLGY